MSKVLISTVTVHDSESGESETFAPGTAYSAELGKKIPNEAAWGEAEEGDVSDFELDGTRNAMLEAARRVGLEPGKDFPKTAGKEVIAAEIKRKLFGDDNPDAELTGDSPSALALDTASTPGSTSADGTVAEQSGRRASRRSEGDEG